MAQVFISYSRKDLTFVEQLVLDLKKTGIQVWYDLSGLEGGSRWGVEIRNAIQNSDYVVVVLSPDSVESEWVEREYLHSNNLKKKILPILYRDCEIPLGFLNLNYIDARGENYSRNFDKITRFLNMELVPSSSVSAPVKRQRVVPGIKLPLFATLGVVATLGMTAIVFLFNARDTNRGIGSISTDIPVQTPVQPTTSTEMTIEPVFETPTTVPSLATSTEPVPTSILLPMVTRDLTQDDHAALAVYIQSAESRNMTAQYALLEDSHATDPSVLVFATSYFGPSEVRNIHPIGVRFTEALTWAILNQDSKSMPHEAAFNVQILNAGQNAYIHMATASNTTEYWTVLDHDLASDQDSLIFAISNWSPPDQSMKPNTVDIGVRYTESRQWAIVNQNPQYPMRVGAAFNVLILSPNMNAFVHTATNSNTTGNYTVIEEPFALDPNKRVFVMPRIPLGDDGVYNDHPIGVWYSSKGWAIYNQDANITMPVDAEFNVLILDAK